MAPTPTSTRSWIVANRTKGLATFSSDDPDATLKIEERPLPALGPDQVLVKVLYLSNDPAQRLSIEPNMPADRLYTAPAELREPMPAMALGEVVASTADALPTGTVVFGGLGWSEYCVRDAAECQARPPLPHGLSLTHYLGALGWPGLTAYYGLVYVGEVKRGMRVVISGAAGATGSMAVQVAKHIVGCSEVIGIAGTDEKCRWVESLGADKCLNYRSKTFEEDLIKLTHGYVDAYFDNVGGTILDAMLGRVRQNGVIIACGSVSSYNSNEPTLLKNYMQIVTMRLSVRGFIAIDFIDKNTETLQLFLQGVKDGKIKIADENEQVVDTRFEDIPKTWLKLFDGSNTGKLVTKLI